MLLNETEYQDSTPGEDQDLDLEDESNEETEDELEDDEISDEVEKYKKNYKNQKIRAEKAEKELKALKGKLKQETETPKKEESDAPDYAEKLDKLTLKSEGIKHPDDQKLVLDEAKRLKLPVEEVANMEHIKAKLKDARDQREALAGAPKGKGKAGGANQQNVDYWLAKGETPDDLELAEKVINARMKQEKSKNTFSDDLY